MFFLISIIIRSVSKRVIKNCLFKLKAVGSSVHTEGQVSGLQHPVITSKKIEEIKFRFHSDQNIWFNTKTSSFCFFYQLQDN